MFNFSLDSHKNAIILTLEEVVAVAGEVEEAAATPLAGVGPFGDHEVGETRLAAGRHEDMSAASSDRVLGGGLRRGSGREAG